MKKALLLCAAFLAVTAGGCKKRSVEEPPVPKAPGQAEAPVPVPDAATQVGVSTSGKLGTMLNAPGNYMQGMAGNIDKAKKAADQYNKIAADRMNMDPETGK